MIAKRPIYYTILPSIVIIIGYVWYRRKRNDGRVDCDTGGGNKLEQNQQQQQSCKLLGDNQELNSSDRLYSSSSSAVVVAAASGLNSQHPSESLPIGTPQLKLKINSCNSISKTSEEEEEKQSQSPGSSAGSSSSSLCKSAPIDIAPNPRSPPKRITEQEIDCEILKLKPEESDIKNLRYIEEQDLESDIDETPTPADSPPYRARVFKNSQMSEKTSTEPVIVKGTMEAKISPENSFRERKYTHTESDESDGHQEDVRNSNDNGCIMPDDDKEVTEATNATEPATQPAEQQIASPSLSMCSMHSGNFPQEIS